MTGWRTSASTTPTPTAKGILTAPMSGHGTGLRGLWHAHTGWLLETQGQADWKRYAGEFYEDPAMRKIGRRFPLLAFISLLVPTGRIRPPRFHASGALRG